LCLTTFEAPLQVWDSCGQQYTKDVMRDHLLRQHHWAWKNVCHINNTKTVCEYREKAPWEFDKSLCKAKAEGNEGHKVKLPIHRRTCTLLVSQNIMCAGILQLLSVMEFHWIHAQCNVTIHTLLQQWNWTLRCLLSYSWSCEKRLVSCCVGYLIVVTANFIREED
jgi:hypothetical protein